MAEVKFIDCNFDLKSGISTVWLQSKYGHFTGESKLCEEDRPYASYLTGCRFAEYRALIKAIKAELKVKTAERIGYAQAISMLESNGCDRKQVISLKKHLKAKDLEIKNLRMQIGDYQSLLKKSIKLRDEYIEKRNRDQAEVEFN